ncbi:MAG: UvrD-helicase domain-containing protein [Desulfuromonadales bacterium]
MSRPVPDLEQRRLAIDPAISCVVQAPAGSGKTELLTRRFLALLAVTERPEEILAITFTRKAAGEMRTRLLQALTRATGPCPEKEHEAQTWSLARGALGQDKRHGWNLLENPGRLSIQTIDGFNASLVRSMPWLSRLGGMPRVHEAPAALYRRAAERALKRLGQGDAGIARLLAHLDNRLDHLRDLLVSMLPRRDQWLRHLAGRRGEENRSLLENGLRLLVEDELAAINELIPVAVRIELAELAPFAAANLIADGKDGLLADLAALPGFPVPSADNLPAWRGIAELLLTADGGLRKAINKNCGFPAGKQEPCLSMKERMQRVLDGLAGEAEVVEKLGRVRALPPVAYEEGQWEVLRALVDLLPLTVAELWMVFREEGAVDFAEIALKAQMALGEEDGRTGVLLRLDNRLRHILVDEFQDTSHMQFDLLRMLTEGWADGDARTLFLVGDPMQSIYRFREAEVGLFLHARRKGVGEMRLHSIRLCANFRSQAGIVDWVNTAFAVLFPAAEDAARGAVPLSAAEAVHDLLPGAAVEIHPWAERNDSAEAQRVVQLAERGLANGDTVAILVRSRSHLRAILPALRQAGIRYQAQDVDLLTERPVARDLVCLTRALLHPDDRLAWLTVLRAPWCGLTLGDLHALCGGRSAAIASLLEDQEILARLSPDGRRRAERAAFLLARAGRQRGRVGLRQMVEGCWLALGGPVLLDEAAMEDAERVLGLLEELDHGGDLRDFADLDNGLHRLFAAPDAQADGHLQIMTIHRAKGLEFDTVILPGLGRRAAGGDPALLRWLEHPRYGLLLGPIHPRDGVSRDPIYDAIGRVEKDQEDLETVRLLYVAATRAKKRLHLLGHAPRAKDGACRPEAGSLLRKMWPVVENAYAEIDEAGAGEAPPVTGPAPLRRLPSHWQPPAIEAIPLPVMAETISPSGLGKNAGNEIVFSGWEAETARHLGTVAHSFLERIGREGLDCWSVERALELRIPARRLLSRSGVPDEEIEGAAAKILRCIENALSGERGLWLLRKRPGAACEFALSGVSNGQIIHAVVDRTFIDEEKTRWIIDYKTSEPRAGEDLQAFLAAEGQRYRPQLAAYAELFRQLAPHDPVRAGLYFPLIDAWYEVEMLCPAQPAAQRPAAAL